LGDAVMISGLKLCATTKLTSGHGNDSTRIGEQNSFGNALALVIDQLFTISQLARRLFYSFVKPQSDVLLVEDIQRFFTTQDEADAVFSLFDMDSNGDATRDEVEMACM
jgi:hypothetical protein